MARAGCPGRAYLPRTLEPLGRSCGRAKRLGGRFARQKGVGPADRIAGRGEARLSSVRLALDAHFASASAGWVARYRLSASRFLHFREQYTASKRLLSGTGRGHPSALQVL